MTKKALVNPNLGTLTRVCLALAVGLAFSTTAHAQILSATSDGTGTQRHKVDQGKVEIRINVTPGKGSPPRRHRSKLSYTKSSKHRMHAMAT